MTRRRTKAEMEAARKEEARAVAAAAEAAAAEKESISLRATSFRLKLTNHWSDDEQRELHHAGEVLRQMKADKRRHREEWLTVIGPKVLMVCDRIFEVTGATSRHDQAYRNVVNETLAHYGLGLDQIDRDTRSALISIMQELPAVENWLAGLTKSERLNNPRTIWKHFGCKYEETEDGEDYLGEDPEEEITCDKCGQKTTRFITRAEGLYCAECHYANPEGVNTGGEDRAGEEARGDDESGEMQISPELEQEIRTWCLGMGMPKDAIEDMFAGDQEKDKDTGKARRTPRINPCDIDPEQRGDEPEYVTRNRACRWQLHEAQRIADEFALLREGTEPQEITDQVIADVEKTINAWSELLAKLQHGRRPEHAPPTVPADDDGRSRLTAKSSTRP